MTNKPFALNPGDTIGIIAPASNLNIDLFHKGTSELERLGYKTKYREDILLKERYTAGSLERRLQELQQLWIDPTIKAIFAARGGYGCLPLLPYLDLIQLCKTPKILLGYSDITALHLFFYKNCNLVTFHGPMVAKDFAGEEEHYELDSFLKLITNTNIPGILTSPQTRTLSPGIATGRIVGGCLPIITSLIGTPWELNTKDCILFLEDTNAKPYQIDRMMHQLKYSGAFNKVRGIIFGEMSGCIQHPNQGYTLDEVLFDILSPFCVPIIYGWKSGHSEYKNQTLPLGVNILLDASKQEINILESTVL